MKLETGQVAVITGGASGIGRAMADAFADRGLTLVIADIEASALVRAQQELESRGAQVVVHSVDVSDPRSVAELAEVVRGSFGAPDVLCLNAGVGGGGPIAQLTLDDWRWVLGVNLYGVIHGIQYFLPAMLEAEKQCHIVNTASVAGLVCEAWMGPYNASKYAVVAISETLAKECADTKVGISVLCPGFVNTRIAESSRNAPADADLSTPPEEMAEVIAAVLADGLEPAKVAARVVEAIEGEQLYILTHPDLTPALETRFEAILAASPKGE
jgi:NAD(P)-dependent dehydrogenase (short-subunit alcohol dehydrogenase family)